MADATATGALPAILSAAKPVARTRVDGRGGTRPRHHDQPRLRLRHELREPLRARPPRP